MLKKKGTRREFLKTVGIAGAAGLGGLVGGPLVRKAFAATDIQGGEEIHRVDENEKGGTLNYFTWAGYDADSVLNPFRKKYNCTVNTELLTTDPDAIMKLKAGATRQFHLITLNNFWSRDMYEDKLILALDNDTYKPYFDKFLPRFKWPFEWAMSKDDKLLGIPQRFGPANFVINTKKISKKTAEDEGWNLMLDPKNKGRWAMMDWDTWCLFGMCNGAGVYPFKKHTKEEMGKIEEACKAWFRNAKFVSEGMVEMNNALINNEIDWYAHGSTFSCSAARREGHWEVVCITPRKGSQAGGVGGVVWYELTNIVNNPDLTPLADDFLAYMMEPSASYHIAMADSTHNPVANMKDPKVFEQFSKDDLRSIQWDDLEEDLSYCEDYREIPDYLSMMKFYRRARATRGKG